jgi:hypothetical protein
MPFKTLLSIIGVDQSDEHLKAAIGLCQEFGLTFPFSPSLLPPPPIGEYAAVLSDVWQEVRNAGTTKLQARINSYAQP